MYISEIGKAELTDSLIDAVLFEGLEDRGENADCIVVLGSFKASEYRVPVAVSAYREGRAPKLMFCGGKPRDFEEGRMSEADHMLRTALEMGVRREDVILENESLNTVENVLGALFMLQREFCINRIGRVLLVTTAYHMRRSLAVARYLFPDRIEVMPCPADDVRTNRVSWNRTPEGRRRAEEEVRKIAVCVGNGLFPDFEIPERNPQSRADG